MTVSAPATFARSRPSNPRSPNARVLCRRPAPSGLLPGPRPQPPTAAAAHSSAMSRLLRDIEDDAIGPPAARIVAVEGLVDDVDVEDVAPARQGARQEVVDVRAVADAEPEAVGGPALQR